ncbi:MAG: helix-turn-helix domain-containing protein [Bacteroidetes bacterium]|nr:helix-turn-helix domain-containing protein [Bacteroidota bacterium]
MAVISLEQTVRAIVREEMKSISGDAEKFIDIKRAAELLSCSVHAIYRRTCENKIPFYKISGRILFRESELVDCVIKGRRRVIK